MINTDEVEVDEDDYLQAFDDDEEIDDTFPIVNIRECCGAGCLRCTYSSN